MSLEKQRISAVIVDDEPLARARLRALLAAHGVVRIVGEAGRLAEARRLVAEETPDAVFLDIQLFGRSGFDLLEELPEGTRVVFVTAFDAYAIRAFEVNALDYLLKPVSPERLALTVRRLCGEASACGASGPLKPDDRIFLRDGKRRWFEPVSSVCAVRADGDYSTLTLRNDAHVMVRRSLKDWLRVLPPDGFLHVHRGLIVNIACVQSAERGSDGRLRLVLCGVAERFAVSRRREPALLSRLKSGC